MKSILFLDKNSSFAYDKEALDNSTLGGTEATVVRIAEKLGEHYNIVVAVGNKITHTVNKGVQYIPFSPYLLNIPWHAVIVLRVPEVAFILRGANSSVPIWLWIHDLMDVRFLAHVDRLRKNNIGVVAVSDFLQKELHNLTVIDPYLPGLPKNVRIYNPVDDAIVPDTTPVDKTKLLFASSSYKGLFDTLRIFKQLRQRQGDFELIITNPGYHPTELPHQEGVTYLGPLTHQKNLQQMRESLALFQMNHVVPETFGLVLAESNAVGTPVLTHPLGAAPEVLQNKDQLINTYDRAAVIDRILQWRFQGRPQVQLPEKFRLSEVIKDWESILT